MRRWIRLLFVVLALAWAAPAFALEEGEFALTPQLGMVTLPGSLGGLFAADFGYGAGVAYGITNLVGIEADFIYSVHQELDIDETGTLDLVHFVAGIGPRFNWQNRVGVLYLGAEFAMAFLRYQARWPVGDHTMRDDNSAHGFGGALSFGGDFRLPPGRAFQALQQVQLAAGLGAPAGPTQQRGQQQPAVQVPLFPLQRGL